MTIPNTKAFFKDNHCSYFKVHPSISFPMHLHIACSYSILIDFSFWVVILLLIHKNSLCIPYINYLPVSYVSNTFPHFLEKSTDGWLAGDTRTCHSLKISISAPVPWHQSEAGFHLEPCLWLAFPPSYHAFFPHILLSSVINCFNRNPLLGLCF